MPAKPPRPTLACFGEILWDILPRGIFLGGAPLNVAYHASRLGLQALPISAVGMDLLGDEALRRIAGWGLDPGFVTRLRRRPTGTVRANLDRRGIASYTIAPQVAWDRIVAFPALRRREAPCAVVYGTLALRGEANRVTFIDLMAAWPGALRVLDLNLRAPYGQGGGVKLALSHAQFVKLNDEELALMTRRAARTATQLEAAAREFAKTHQLVRVCVTAGARGAGLLWDEAWHWEPGRPVEVRDTVGAGDAFLAGFLAAHFLRRESPRAALAGASRLGEFVAGRDGATPPYRIDAQGRPVDAAPATGGQAPR
ncbi:MAG TPA: PfkB family carbohydrate kinase [Lacunisphaera sp.]|nr:PfkB family carbohydrate kinase [Lacunisphaera sp.]